MPLVVRWPGQVAPQRSSHHLVHQADVLATLADVLGAEQLERLGYDPEGALYKCAGQVDPQFSSTGGFQKLLPKTNLWYRADYLQLANGINESKPLATRRTTVFDLLDVAEVVQVAQNLTL